MSPLALAWRGLIRQPARAALGIVGIAAVGALLFDMLLLSRGLVLSFRDLLSDTGYDVRVTATESLPGFGPSMENASGAVTAIRALPEVQAVLPLVFGSAEIARPAGSTPSDPSPAGSPPPTIQLTGSGTEAPANWTLLEGEPLRPAEPGAPPPLIIDRAVATRFALAPGSGVELRGVAAARTALPPVRFRVAGIADFHFSVAGQMAAVTTLQGYYLAHGEPDRNAADLLVVASASGFGPQQTVAAIRRALPGVEPFSNEQLLRRFQATDFSYFRQISLVLSSITLLFAFILVTTLLTVSVNQRFGEIAGLRAIGFTRGRVAADLLCESALLVGSGGLLALPLGGLLAVQLDRILRNIPGLPERIHFFVFEPRAVVLYAALLLVTGALAAAYPVFLAARLPIARTLRNEVVS